VAACRMGRVPLSLLRVSPDIEMWNRDALGAISRRKRPLSRINPTQDGEPVVYLKQVNWRHDEQAFDVRDDFPGRGEGSGF
jgi:hypothetical protein